MLAKPGSDLQCKCKSNCCLKNASTSVGPDARRSYLVYRNAELSDHPEHEALIISSSPPLALPVLFVSLHCSIYAYVDGVHTVLRMFALQI